MERMRRRLGSASALNRRRDRMASSASSRPARRDAARSASRRQLQWVAESGRESMASVMHIGEIDNHRYRCSILDTSKFVDV